MWTLKENIKILKSLEIEKFRYLKSYKKFWKILTWKGLSFWYVETRS